MGFLSKNRISRELQQDFADGSLTVFAANDQAGEMLADFVAYVQRPANTPAHPTNTVYTPN